METYRIYSPSCRDITGIQSDMCVVARVDVAFPLKRPDFSPNKGRFSSTSLKEGRGEERSERIEGKF
ncbi:hypothetical protein AAMO2058_000904300 [Amorphochlora amoebiformis]|eukprot:384904-Amorphochlora_amoeboformis.AAC.1